MSRIEYQVGMAVDGGMAKKPLPVCKKRYCQRWQW